MLQDGAARSILQRWADQARLPARKQGAKVKHIRIVLLTTLLLLPAARVWAAPQYDYAGQPNELYHAEVCNQGRLAVDVAVAYRDFGFSDEFWMVDYWYRVEPGKCKLVFSHFYAPNNLFSFQSFPLHVAFAFTDSTGVWGAAKVQPPRGIASSRLKLCVERVNNKYRVDTKDPGVKCPKGILVPASIDWEPTQGVYPNAYSRQYPPPIRFTVALGPNDRAIPVGSQASSGGAVQGPGTIQDFASVLRDLIKRSGKTTAPDRYWSACIEPTVVKTHLWKNPPPAQLKSLQDAVIQFLTIHDKGNVRFRITERSGKFVVEEYRGEFCHPFYGVG
jgi:Protein of unknown function (DUF1036)